MQELEVKLNNLLIELFNNHEVKGLLTSEGLIYFPEQQIKAHCHLYNKTSTSMTLVQLDVDIEFGIGRWIIESCAGVGADLENASLDAFKSFTSNSFHVILSAFFTSKYDQEINKEQWNIRGKTFDVITSNIGIRGKQPEATSYSWVDQFRIEVEKQDLFEGIHWMRLFYAIHDRQIDSCEVLLDNDIWHTIRKEAEKFDVPKTIGFYTFRLFYILQNGFDISRLAAIIAWATQNSVDQEEAYNKINSSFSYIGLPSLDIDKAYIMIPLALSHAFIEINAPNALTTKAIIIGKKDKSVEIDLKDEYFFIESYKWAKQALSENQINKEDLLTLLSMSSTFNALNNALNQGSKVEDLVLSGAVMFIQNYFESDEYNDKSQPKSNKPFWKFW